MELTLSRRDLDSTKQDGGLIIHIPGVFGDPNAPDTNAAIFIEEWGGKIQINIWDGKEDPIIIKLTNKEPDLNECSR
jgi:hypothetical protein